MLYRLVISNIAVIDKAEVEFENGLNILTGETGAGKSIVIDAISMLLGRRSNRDIIRYGADRACVEAAFFLDAASKAAFADYVEEDDDMLIISRQLHQDGKNICTVNGKMVSVSVLKELGKNLINIFGQQDSYTLLNQGTHIEYVDKYYYDKLNTRLEEYGKLYSETGHLKEEIESLLKSDENKIERLENLEFWANEIKSANLIPGEDDELRQRKQIIKNFEKIYTTLSGVYDVLYSNDEFTAYSALQSASKELFSIEDFGDEIKETAALTNECVYKIEEAAHLISKYMQSMSFDEEELVQIEERLDLIHKLKLKYGNSIEEILECLENFENEITAIQTSDEKLTQLKTQLADTEKKMVSAGNIITALRKEAAGIIEDKVIKELAELNMANVKFEIAITPAEPCANGMDRVEFLISTNPAEPLKPLVKIASGGEMSRICLALKSVLSGSDVAGTMIFDEIDSGVSGRAAQKIAEKMKALAKGKQLICITHLPQIAAAADSHYLILKDENAEHFSTDIFKLDKKGRVAELARIISGEKMGVQAIKAAEEMLDSI